MAPPSNRRRGGSGSSNSSSSRPVNSSSIVGSDYQQHSSSHNSSVVGHQPRTLPVTTTRSHRNTATVQHSSAFVGATSTAESNTNRCSLSSDIGNQISGGNSNDAASASGGVSSMLDLLLDHEYDDDCVKEEMMFEAKINNKQPQPRRSGGAGGAQSGDIVGSSLDTTMEDGDDGLLLVASGDIDGSNKKLHVTSGINHRLSNAAIFADTVEELLDHHRDAMLVDLATGDGNRVDDDDEDEQLNAVFYDADTLAELCTNGAVAAAASADDVFDASELLNDEEDGEEEDGQKTTAVDIVDGSSSRIVAASGKSTGAGNIRLWSANNQPTVGTLLDDSYALRPSASSHHHHQHHHHHLLASNAVGVVVQRRHQQQHASIGAASTHASIKHQQPQLHLPYNASAVARGAGTNSVQQLGWQATKASLKERFSFMFCNEILADVHFIVGRGDQRQRIPAHKFLLSTGSAVFDAMFNGAMASNSSTTADVDIELPDVESAAFLALLKFLYSDDVTIGPESVMTTLYTAKKYAVPALENACVDFLKHNLSPDNAFMLLTQARLFDEPQLAALCLEMIDKHTTDAIAAEGFTDIDLETLCAVLERDTLRIREAPLYAAIVRWSTEDCHRQQLPVTPENQRDVLGRALNLIRFPLMTVEEFAQSAAQSGILMDREIVNLFLYFTVNPKPSVGFLDVPRCCVIGKEQIVNRFQRIEGRWGYSGTPDRIKFTVDRKIFVVGFGLYGSIHGPTEYQATIQIIHCGTGKVLATNDTTFICDGSSTTFRVLFKEPVEIAPSITYIASGCLKGSDSHYGTKGLRRIVHQSPTNGCVTFQFTYAAGNNNGTSVEDGQIPEIIFFTKLT